MPIALVTIGSSPALFGVISALVGVIAGGALTALQQRAQRKHDAAENTKARIIQLRREIYVATVEHHGKARASLESRPMVSERDFKDIQAKFLSSLFKIQMVGSNRSIVAANVVARLYHAAASDQGQDPVDVRAATTSYEYAKNRAIAANEQLDAIEHELHLLQPHESGGNHALQLREQLVHAKEAATSAEAHLSVCQNRRNEALVRYASETAPRLAAIDQASIRLLDCMRDDLNLPSVDDETQDALRQNRDLFMKQTGHQAAETDHDSSL